MGVNVIFIQALGDWSSDAYKTYLSIELSDKVSAINKMYSWLSNLSGWPCEFGCLGCESIACVYEVYNGCIE